MNLKEFLLGRNITDIEEVTIIEGQEPFKIKPVTNKQLDDITKQCTKVKDGEVIFNTRKQNLLFIVDNCVEPDFRDAEFLKQLNCVDPMEAVEKVLKAGEIATLVKKISEISGFDTGINKKIKLAKN